MNEPTAEETRIFLLLVDYLRNAGFPEMAEAEAAAIIGVPLADLLGETLH
jgi:hypothetical protein